MSNARKDELKGLITANSFSGPSTFFRRHPGNDYGNADVVVYGLPYDLGGQQPAGVAVRAAVDPRGVAAAGLGRSVAVGV